MTDGLPVRGERVVLRRCRVADLPILQAYRTDPEVARFQSWPQMSDDEARGFLAEVATATPLLRRAQWNQIAVADPESDEMIGDMGLFLSEDGREAEIGISLSRAGQGAGRATEAVRLAAALVFDNSGAEVIHGICDIRNTPSLVMLARAGLRAVREETSDKDGEPVTERYHVMTRSAHE